MTDGTPEDFDCIEFTRQARREIYEETKHMSLAELHEYWRKFRESDPFLQRLLAAQAERAYAGKHELIKTHDGKRNER